MKKAGGNSFSYREVRVWHGHSEAVLFLDEDWSVESTPENKGIMANVILVEQRKQ